MRLVLDTTVLISAIRSRRGAAAAVLARLFESDYVLLMDYRISCEYRDVASRAHHVENSALSQDEIARLIRRLEARADSVEIIARHRPLSVDPGDDLVLDLAINGHADTIVSYNLRHLRAPAHRFGISVVQPATLLVRMRQAGLHGSSE
jgi:putative PIN family toxin of toxin-antitoxin system